MIQYKPQYIMKDMYDIVNMFDFYKHKRENEIKYKFDN